ncbi:hypothetical protein M0813_20367 [Anaeramoeba flamelloides]|uniref:PH domain-containing protein n=1 Tax=Anaeramoeba flamelloides TaxID=1746091 RepID=A0ABQ8YLR0_9EUKA|nr:hypothetical protein M0813_20367 [Anaeramoeba flamelloides]
MSHYRKIHKILNLPSDEEIFSRYRCALREKSGLLRQGMLYLSSRTISFHSNLFGIQKTLKISLSQAVLIEKRTFFKLNNSIRIKTIKHSDGFFFTSFLSRDLCLRELIALHNLVKRSTKSSNRNEQKNKTMKEDLERESQSGKSDYENENENENEKENASRQSIKQIESEVLVTNNLLLDSDDKDVLEFDFDEIKGIIPENENQKNNFLLTKSISSSENSNPRNSLNELKIANENDLNRSIPNSIDLGLNQIESIKSAPLKDKNSPIIQTFSHKIISNPEKALPPISTAKPQFNGISQEFNNTTNYDKDNNNNNNKYEDKDDNSFNNILKDHEKNDPIFSLIKVGYLKIFKKELQKWILRYFRLSIIDCKVILSIYNNEYLAHKVADLDLTGHTIGNTLKSLRTVKGVMFKLKTNKVLRLIAENREEALDWIKSLKKFTMLANQHVENLHRIKMQRIAKQRQQELLEKQKIEQKLIEEEERRKKEKNDPKNLILTSLSFLLKLVPLSILVIMLIIVFLHSSSQPLNLSKELVSDNLQRFHILNYQDYLIETYSKMDEKNRDLIIDYKIGSVKPSEIFDWKNEVGKLNKKIRNIKNALENKQHSLVQNRQLINEIIN